MQREDRRIKQLLEYLTKTKPPRIKNIPDGLYHYPQRIKRYYNVISPTINTYDTYEVVIANILCFSTSSMSPREHTTLTECHLVTENEKKKIEEILFG